MNGKVLECIHKATGDRRALKVGTSGRGGLLLELGDPGLFVGGSHVLMKSPQRQYKLIFLCCITSWKGLPNLLS